MKRIAVLLVLASLGFAPVLPANPVQLTAAVEICTMDCCHQADKKSDTGCANACKCAVPCVLPTQTTGAAVPAVTEICPPTSRALHSDDLSDESASERNVRPPVPPPRA
ncbi:MAG: hypothetical protein ACKOJB_15870 [Chthoniobacterales bacterium]